MRKDLIKHNGTHRMVLIIPIMLLTNSLWGMTGLIWSQLAADVLNAFVACASFLWVERQITHST